ncbi:AAA family ATPase [Photorhabdus aegyptia]|uniref:Putative ATPase n=1 Tax=Photorhabdus aegyptia TaxID=2805098 RepID=A0A022PFG7_9GAMM|nr:AAA family ATPase [Photorhabdus aegyptia]EYU13150.1 putative ATPase [Photorhabdus aegyptia]
MLFLRSISYKNAINEDDSLIYPLNIKCIRNIEKVEFNSPVTFFVGENGSGKSTLLEALAIGLNAVHIGSNEFDYDESMVNIQDFSNRIRFVRNAKPLKTIFFRAEDVLGFIKRISKTKEDLNEMENAFLKEIKGDGKYRAVGAVRGQLRELTQSYGDDPYAKSHGETFLNILQKRFYKKSLFFLDEPETPLSPLRQLALISLIKHYVGLGAQFVIATHSPILMAFPGADVLHFNSDRIEMSDYNDIEHVVITKSFLNNPELYLRDL